MSLPILSSLFFEKHTPDVGFFSKWQSLLPWSDQMVPIYEWQGVLYVGCSRPPDQTPELSAKVVYVLCEPEALKQIWYDIHGTVVADFRASLPSAPKHETQIPNDAPEGLSLDFNVSSAPSDDVLSLLQDEESSSDSEDSALSSDEESASEEEDLLQFPGLDGDQAIANPLSDKTSVVSLRPVKDDSISFPVLNKDPASILQDTGDHAVESPVSEDTGEIEIRDLRFESPVLSQETTIQRPQSKIQNPVQPAFSAETMIQKPMPSASPQATLLNSVESTLQKPKQPSSVVTIRSETVTGINPEQRATPSQSEVIHNSRQQEKDEVTSTAITAITQTYSGTLDTDMLDLFKEMEMKFSKVMILLKNGDQIKPWKWNLKFKAPDKENLSYSLMNASPLRIVYRTHMPYHGYVVANDFNNKFFRDWNESQIPEHLTVVPILVKDHVVGMLLGLSEKQKDDYESLLLAERVADKLTAKIKTRPKLLTAS